MHQVINIALITILAFAFTSFEDLLLLMGFQISPQTQTPRIGNRIFMGYLIAATIVQLLGFLSAYAANFVSPVYIGYLGIIPILLGVYIYILHDSSTDTFVSRLQASLQ